MLLPARADDVRVEPALRPDQAGIEQVLGPGAQRSLDPFTDRYSESGLRTIDQLARNEAVQQLAHDMFAATAADLEAERDSGCELGDAMVEERDACFERHGH